MKALGLTATGATNVNDAGGMSVSPTYVVHFYLPNKAAITGVLVTDSVGGANFGAIIGMDVITLGDMAITNVGGQTWMSFRTPSTMANDYVVEHRKPLRSAVGRNNPCPRNSGKRFKHCHGK